LKESIAKATTIPNTRWPWHLPARIGKSSIVPSGLGGLLATMKPGGTNSNSQVQQQIEENGVHIRGWNVLKPHYIGQKSVHLESAGVW